MSHEIRRAWRENATLTIANGGTTTGPFEGSQWAGYGLILPASFTGTTLTFTVCGSAGGTYVALYDAGGNAVSMTVAQNRAYDLPAELYAWPFWKIVSGSTEGGERTLTVCAKA